MAPFDSCIKSQDRRTPRCFQTEGVGVAMLWSFENHTYKVGFFFFSNFQMDTFRGDHTHCFLNEALVRGFSSLAEPGAAGEPVGDRKGVVEGKGVDLGGCRIIKKKIKKIHDLRTTSSS